MVSSKFAIILITLRVMEAVKWHETSMSILILLPPHTMKQEFMMIIDEQIVTLTAMNELVVLNEFLESQDTICS